MRSGNRVKLAAIRTAQRSSRFAEFIRKPKGESVAGYLLEHSPDCLLLEELDWDSFRWNGKCIIWKRDVRTIRCFEDTDWPMIAARALKMARTVELVRSSLPVPDFL